MVVLMVKNVSRFRDKAKIHFLSILKKAISRNISQNAPILRSVTRKRSSPALDFFDTPKNDLSCFKHFLA